ncbi:MAG: hypothetical protein ACYTEW_19360 [Planctomycetota bacterium]|jgi:predicted CXXCH cytochrome family protein
MKHKVIQKISWITFLERQPTSTDPFHRITSSLRSIFVPNARYFAIATFFCFVRANIVLGEQSQKIVPLHHFRKPCDSCHMSESVDSIDKPKEPDSFRKVKDDINHLCTSLGCHDFDALLNHPVGVTPKGEIPTNMPLDSHSRITCLTCHEVPEFSGGPDRADVGLEHSLQRPSGVEFCAKCHMKMGGTLLEQSHWRFSARAHLGPMNPQAVPFQTSEQRISGIDTESRMCLTCHDNISVTIPFPNEIARQKRARWKTISDHPIGMDYQYTALRKNRRYNFPLTDRQFRLFDGKLGCGSCHSPYSKLKDNLVMLNIRGALCRRCHNM